MAGMLVLAAVLAVPLLEVAAFVAVGLAAGWLLAVALLLGTSGLGVLVLRAESRAALGRFSAAASQHRPPGPVAIDTALGLLGGVLLAIPGFVTDVLAVSLLLPPTRRLIRRQLSRRLAQRVMRFAATAERFGARTSRMPPADVDASAIEDEPRRLDR
jgi:UPF0716 protein FxsA